MIVMLTTCPTEKDAKALARKVVEKKIAACASIIEIGRSFYRWKGKVHEEPEWLLLIKTKDKMLSRLEVFVKANHPHEVPEIISFKTKHADGNYEGWVKRNTLFF